MAMPHSQPIDFRLHGTEIGTGPQPASRTLFVGKDNYDVLRGMDSATIDLVAMDPPFNKNVPFIGKIKERALLARLQERRRENNMSNSPSVDETRKIKFRDIWSWDMEWHKDWMIRLGTHPKYCGIRNVIRAAKSAHGEPMAAYICFMAARCLELKRILKEDGSLFLHCDHTACHYLRAMLDAIFGAHLFKSQIIWKRHWAHNSSRSFGNTYDVLLFYGTKNVNHHMISKELDPAYVDKQYRHDDNDGRGRYRLLPLTGAGTRCSEPGVAWRGTEVSRFDRHWAVPQNLPDFFKLPENWGGMGVPAQLDELDRQRFILWPKNSAGKPQYKFYLCANKGQTLGNIWLDPSPIRNSKEQTGWPTQKPLELYERIILACSNPGDTVLDPFCGCATTCVAAERITQRGKGVRHWIGIEIADDAGVILEYRLGKDVSATAAPGTGNVFVDAVIGEHVKGLQDKLIIRDFIKNGAAAIPQRTDNWKDAEPYVSPKTMEGIEWSERELRYVSDYSWPDYEVTRKKELGELQWEQNPDLAAAGLYKCEVCQHTANHLNFFLVDHIIPLQVFRQSPRLAQRATPEYVHNLIDLQLACPTCIEQKQARSILFDIM